MPKTAALVDVGLPPGNIYSMRDQFATAVIAGLAADHVNPDQRCRREMTRLAYAWADAMLDAREIPPDQLKNLVR